MGDINIWKEEGWYTAEIPALGIVDQAKTLKGLRKELKEAIEVSVESILKDMLKLHGSQEKALQLLFIDSVLKKVDLAISKNPAKYKKIALAKA